MDTRIKYIPHNRSRRLENLKDSAKYRNQKQIRKYGPPLLSDLGDLVIWPHHRPPCWHQLTREKKSIWTAPISEWEELPTASYGTFSKKYGLKHGSPATFCPCHFSRGGPTWTPRLAPHPPRLRGAAPDGASCPGHLPEVCRAGGGCPRGE